MRYLSLWMISVILQPSWAQEAPSQFEKDRAAILAMAGCYTVDFHFEEVASFQAGYDLKPAYDSKGLEWVVAEEVSEKKIVLQHLLQTSRGVIKHWRQDWEYESQTLWEFKGNRHWEKKEYSKAEVKGTWTQRVFQVDDSPRYESMGRWVHMGNLSQWESAETNRPLPRREYSKRSDYEILVAKNRHAITPTGWIHEQDNYKLHREEGTEQVIAREFGLNRYDYVRDEQLKEAQAWWEENRQIWSDVRSVWSQVFSNNPSIYLRADLDDKPLYRHIFRMAEQAAEEQDYRSDIFKSRIEEIINQFLTSPEQAATKGP